MKKLLYLILVLFAFIANAQDPNPLPSITVKKLIAPNTPVFYYDQLDSSVWVFKGSYGWTKLADSAMVHKKYVPYIGAIKNVNIGTYNLITDAVEFNLAPSNTSTKGTLQWNPTDGTLDLNMGVVTQQIGQELPLPAYNNTGVAIGEGIPVYISGRQGHLPEITPAKSDAESTSTIFGITTTTFGTTGDLRNGFVTTFGYIRQIKTNYTGIGVWGTTWGLNDKLYVSKTVAGQLTNVEPTAPHHSDVVATVSIVGAVGTGSILVLNQKHQTLEELTDVNGTPLTEDGQLPSWHQTEQYFDFDKNINDYVPYTAIEDTKGMSGFINNTSIDAAYDWNTRTVTLTGDLTYYWLGKRKTLASPWTSTAHAATLGSWFLSSTDGINFTWSQSIWGFDAVMVAYVNYQATQSATFAIREPHGVMDYKSHEEMHQQIGTYLLSGGTLIAGTYAENTATDAANSPSFNAAVVKDEDNNTSLPQWNDTGYTTLYIGAANSTVFNISATLPFISAGSYIQYNNTSTGALVTGTNNLYYNVYQVLIPVTSDVSAQKYRMVMLQPQKEFTSLAAAQAEDTRGLALGNLTQLSPEFVFYARITYIAAAGDLNTGKCRIAIGGITYILGSKMSNISASGAVTNNHATQSNLTWTSSGHIGTNNTLAAFDGTGIATNIAKGDLTENAIGLEFSDTRQVIGGAATLTVTSGYLIPTTASATSWDSKDPSIENEIQAPTRVGDLIGLTQTTTTISIADKAPASGSGNYIHNQGAVAQNGKYWLGNQTNQIGTNTSTGDDSALLISRNITSQLSTGSHGIRDESSFDSDGSGLKAYSSFDAIISIIGSDDYEHYVGHQSRMIYSLKSMNLGLFSFIIACKSTNSWFISAFNFGLFCTDS